MRNEKKEEEILIQIFPQRTKKTAYTLQTSVPLIFVNYLLIGLVQWRVVCVCVYV